VTAARPTREWKAATVWGKAVTSTYFPNTAPAAPPAAKRAIA